MKKSDLHTALLVLPEDYRQNAFEFLTEHPDYAPENFIDFIKDQLDQMHVHMNTNFKIKTMKSQVYKMIMKLRTMDMMNFKMILMT